MLVVLELENSALSLDWAVGRGTGVGVWGASGGGRAARFGYDVNPFLCLYAIAHHRHSAPDELTPPTTELRRQRRPSVGWTFAHAPSLSSLVEVGGVI